MDSKKIFLLERALDRQRKSRVQAEKILEEKSKDLYDTIKHLKDSNARLENLLKEKTSELDGAFINIIDPYVVMDLEFNIMQMNSSAKELLGYDCDLEKVNISKLIHPDYIDYTIHANQNLLEVGILKNYRAKIIRKDKSEKYVQVNGSLIYDKNHKPIAAHGIIRDITTETEIKKLLDDQKAELDIIVTNSPLGIVLTDNNKIVRTNKTFAKLVGYTELELNNMYVNDISASENVEKSNELIAKMQNGIIDNFTIIKKYKHKNGTILWAKTSVNAFKNNKGCVKYQVAMVEDISAQRNLEIQKEQLLKELEESNKSLQEYAHIVSHDLKSPLRSISALSTWLYEDNKDVLNKNGKEQLSLLQEKVEAMDNLITGILKYSTVNKDSINNTQVDVNEVIKEITDIIFIPEHVKIRVVKKLPTLFADKTKIHQLFQNFISNAVVHIEKKIGFVNIDFKETSTHWQFSVEDNGVGIPKEYHEKIFKIFQSVGNKERSTGIGLSIVKKIIELYEGRVWLESIPKQGTTFYFTLKKQ